MPLNGKVAIIGIGCKFPGGCNNKDEYYEFLRNKGDGMTEPSPERWDHKEWYGRKDQPGKYCSAKAGFVSDIDRFDALEFGISTKEAKQMDASVHKTLEVAHEALTDSGIDYRGSNTGVYYSQLLNSAEELEDDRYEINGYHGVGRPVSIRANRISFTFDLRGPSLALDTACSSSGTAMHLAMSAVALGDIDQALILGGNTIINPKQLVAISKLGVLSPTGSCKSFDAAGDGYARSEGFGAVVIKRLDAAIRDGDHIYSVVTGSSINSNGKGKALTMPEGARQAEAILRAYHVAERNPSEAFYVELHATGTYVGDPIEANAAGSIFSQGRDPSKTLRVGSVKANIGHTEGCSFLASLIKISMMLSHKEIIPNIRLNRPNPKIDFEKGMMKVQTELEKITPEMAAKDGKWVTSISSYGVGGSNAHVVIESFDSVSDESSAAAVAIQPASRPLYLFTAASLTEVSLPRVQASLVDAFSNVTDDTKLRSLAHDLARQARACLFSSFVVAPSLSASAVFSKPTAINRTLEDKRLCLVFSGQGPQHIAMGRELATAYPEFWRSVQMSNEILIKLYKKDCFLTRTGLFAPGKKTSLAANGIWPVADVVYSLVFFQIALTDLIKSLGVKYDTVIGHSIGEIAMGYASGHYGRETAVGIAVARATAMTLADGNGCMVALGVGVSRAKLMIQKVLSDAGVSEGLWIAGINAVSAVAVSGHENLIDAMVKLAANPNDKVFAAKLRVTCAFHSPLMEPQEAAFKALMKEALSHGTKTPSVRVMSSVDGNWLQRDLDADYCWDNIRRPVIFGAGIKRMVNESKTADESIVFLEIAPHPVLRPYIDECGGVPISLVTRPNLKNPEKNTGEHFQLLEGLGNLLATGYKGIDFDRFYATPDGHEGYAKIEFPSFPYNKAVCWNESGAGRSRRMQKPSRPLARPCFRMNVDTHADLAGHRIFDTPLFPASGYVESILENGATVVHNVQIHKPLALRPSDASPGHAGCVISGNAWEFRASTVDNFEAGNAILDTLYASGTFSTAPLTKPGTFDFSKKLSQSQGSISGKEFYEAIPSAYNYQNHFANYIKVIHEVVDADAWDGTSHLAQLELSPESKDTLDMDYIIHPAILDSVIQVGLALFIDIHSKTYDFNGVFLPVGLEGLTLYDVDMRASVEGGLWVYCQYSSWSPDGPTRSKFIVANSQGQTVVTIDGFQMALAPREYPTAITEESHTSRLATVWQSKNFPAIDLNVLKSSKGAHLRDVFKTLLLLSREAGHNTARIADLYAGPELVDQLDSTLAALGNTYQFYVDYNCIGSSADAADTKTKHLHFGHGTSLLLDNVRQGNDIRVPRFDVVILSASDLESKPLAGLFDLLNLGGFVFLVMDESEGITAAEVLLQKLLADSSSTHRPEGQVLQLVSGSVILLRHTSLPERESASQTKIHHFAHGNEGDLVQTVSTLPGSTELWVLGNDDAAGIGAMGLVSCIAAENEVDVRSLIFEDHSLDKAGREAVIQSLRRKPGLLEQHMKVTRDGDLLVRRLVSGSPQSKASLLMTPTVFNSEKSYILVGGSSELGVQLAQWMAKNGARHLVLTSRRGPKALTKVDRMYIQYLRLAGVQIDVLAANATSHREMATVVKRASEHVSIGGIFLMTVVLRDGKFTNLTQGSFDDVYDSKVTALNTVLSCVQPEALDFLLLFSTIGSVFGNTGQAAYCAAQLYLDRIADTLPNTISISLPPITDTGIFKRLAISTQGRATRKLAKVGMTTAQVCNFVGDALVRQIHHYVPMLNIDAGPEVFPYCEPLLYGHLLSPLLASGASSDSGASVTPATLLAAIVGLHPDQITEDTAITSFGLDSLGATRYSNQLISLCQIQVSQIDLLGNMTVGMLNAMKSSTSSEAREHLAEIVYQDDSQLSQLLPDDMQPESDHLYDPSLIAEMIAINKGGITPRLFMIHDATGMASPFMNLAPYLPNQIYAIGDRQYGSPDGSPSIESMAEHYISLLRAVQPHGPYVIAGYSFGGLVGLSMAAKLVKAGEEVQHLIMFDARMVSEAQRKDSAYSRESAQRAIDSVCAYFPPMSEQQEQELRVEIWKNVRLLAQHDSEFYDGPATLVTPDDNSFFGKDSNLHVEWKQRISNLNWKVSAGRHDTLFAAKNVQKLASVVGEILSAA